MKRTRHTESEFPSSVIVDIVNDIRQSTLTMSEKKSHFAKKYPDFFEVMPVLAESSCDPTFDYRRFQYMMRMRDQVLEQKITHDNASKEIGQTLFDHYVKPHLKDNEKM